MKDVQLKLRTAYFEKLSDNSFDAVVYDSFAPASADNTYILITNQADVSDNPKDAFQTIATLTVDIVTRYPKGTGGKKQSELIGDFVLQSIMPKDRSDYLDLSPDFKLVNISKENSLSLVEDYQNEWVFRKIITFRHSIVQLTEE